MGMADGLLGGLMSGGGGLFGMLTGANIPEVLGLVKKKQAAPATPEAPKTPQASKAPDRNAVLAGNAAMAGMGGPMAGNSSTFLTGPAGIDPASLNLGRNTLLGQ